MKRVKLVRPRMCGSKEQILQVKCLIGDEGHVWIGSYDELPPAVRQRLRESPFNLCAACLVFYVLPEVYRQHPSYTRLKALFAAIELMEAGVRNDIKRALRRAGARVER